MMEKTSDEKRKALEKFCQENVLCDDCILYAHRCGRVAFFNIAEEEDGYMTDEEIDAAYKTVFLTGADGAEGEDGENMKVMQNTEQECGCREERETDGKYRNYCDSCARRKSGACNVCESGYDGVPSEYLFELAQKTQAEIRGEILDQAKVCVCTDRKEQYGDAEQSFRCIADLWNAYLKPVYPDICITPVQASMMMVLFKAARDSVANVHKVDTYVDMCGYAACAGGMIEHD